MSPPAGPPFHSNMVAAAGLQVIGRPSSDTTVTENTGRIQTAGFSLAVKEPHKQKENKTAAVDWLKYLILINCLLNILKEP